MYVPGQASRPGIRPGLGLRERLFRNIFPGEIPGTEGSRAWPEFTRARVPELFGELPTLEKTRVAVSWDRLWARGVPPPGLSGGARGGASLARAPGPGFSLARDFRAFFPEIPREVVTCTNVVRARECEMAPNSQRPSPPLPNTAPGWPAAAQAPRCGAGF